MLIGIRCCCCCYCQRSPAGDRCYRSNLLDSNLSNAPSLWGCTQCTVLEFSCCQLYYTFFCIVNRLLSDRFGSSGSPNCTIIKSYLWFWLPKMLSMNSATLQDGRQQTKIKEIISSYCHFLVDLCAFHAF